MLSDELIPGTQRLAQASDEWLVKVSSLVYDVYGAATTVSAAVAALGLKSMALQHQRNVTITGGYGTFNVLRVNRNPVEPTDAVPYGFARSALFASGLPFTEPGDLLVHRPFMAPQVVHKGTTGQVFAQSLTWVDPLTLTASPGLPDSVIHVPHTVSVGPIEHPSPHDQHFATVGEFSEWAASKIVFSTLTVLLNGFAASDIGDVVLPRAVQGATVVFLAPNDYELGPNGQPISRLRLIARSTTISGSLSLFRDFDVADCTVESDDLYLVIRDDGQTRKLFRHCVVDCNRMFVTGESGASAVYEIEHSELDIRELHFLNPGAGISRLRLQDSDLCVRYLFDSASGSGEAHLDLVNSSLLVERKYVAHPPRLMIGALRSNTHFAEGITGV